MIDLFCETPLSLTEAAKSLPGRPHVCTLHRWRLRGVRGTRLETVMVGGRRYTTSESLARFFAAITAASSGVPPPIRTCKQRQRAIEAAELELSKAGI